MALRQRLGNTRVSTPDDDQVLSNPIAGTPYDANRQSFLRGMPTGPQHADETLDDPRVAHPQVETQTAPQSDQNIPEVQGASPQVETHGASAGQSGDGAEDELFNRIMKSSMDDTPSNARIQDLQSQLDERHQKPTIKGKLMALAMMAAPTLAAGLSGGGPYAVGGAAGGTLDTMNTMHDRGMEQDKILRDQMESERGRQERQYERRLQLPIAYGNMRMMRDYRRGVLDLRGKGIDQKHTDDMAKLGLGDDGKPLPDDQLPPTQRERVLLMRAHGDVYDSQVTLNKAKAEMEDAKKDPNSPLFQQTQQKYDAALAQAQAAQSRAESMMLSSKTREAQYYKSAFGTDANGETLPGTFNDPNGTPMGWNAPGNPTANTKQRGQTAATVLHHFDDAPNDPNPSMRKGITSTINDADDKDLGMLTGHVNEWLTGKWGADNPKLSQLRTKLLLASSAMELAHVGQSGGIEMLEHFKSMLNLGQSKANLLANASEIKGWLKGYEQSGTANASVGGANPQFRPLSGGGADTGAGMAKPPTGAGKLTRPQSSAPNQSGGNTVEVWEKDPKTGKPVRKTQKVN